MWRNQVLMKIVSLKEIMLRGWEILIGKYFFIMIIMGVLVL